MATPDSSYKEIWKTDEAASSAAESVATLGRKFLFAGFGSMIFGRQLSDFSQQMSQVLSNMVEDFTEFQWSITRANVLMSKFNREQGILWEEAMKHGRETIYTAAEAAEGFQILAKAGFNTRDAVAVLPSILDLAAIEMGELEEATQIAINALYGFGFAIKENMSLVTSMKSVVEATAYAVRNSAMDMNDFGEALRYVGPIASALGESLANVTTGLMALGNAGIRGGQAGRHLRNIYLRFNKMAGQAMPKAMRKGKEAMNEVQRELSTTEGELKGLLQVHEALNEGLEGFTQSQKMAALMTKFRRRAAQSLVALMQRERSELKDTQREVYALTTRKQMMKKGYQDTIPVLKHFRDQMYKNGEASDYELRKLENTLEKYGLARQTINYISEAYAEGRGRVNKFIETMKDTATSSMMARQQLETLRAKFRQVEASVQSLRITAIAPLSGVLTDLLETTKNFINRIAEINPMIHGMAASILAVSTVLSKFGGIVLNNFGALALLASSIATVGKELYDLENVTGLMNGLNKTFKQGISNIDEALGVTTTTLVAHIAAWAAFAGVLFSIYYFYKNDMLPMQESIESTLGEFSDNLNQLSSSIGQFFSGTVTALSLLYDSFTKLLSPLGRLSPILDAIGAVTLVLNAAIEYLAWRLDKLYVFFKNHKNIAKALAAVLSAILIPTALAFGELMITTVASSLKTATLSMFGYIKSVLLAGSAHSSLLTAIKATKGGQILMAMWNGITSLSFKALSGAIYTTAAALKTLIDSIPVIGWIIGLVSVVGWLLHHFGLLDDVLGFIWKHLGAIIGPLGDIAKAISSVIFGNSPGGLTDLVKWLKIAGKVALMMMNPFMMLAQSIKLVVDSISKLGGMFGIGKMGQPQPVGSRKGSKGTTKEIGNQNNVTVNIRGVTVNNGQDIRDLGRRVGKEVDRKIKRELGKDKE